MTDRLRCRASAVWSTARSAAATGGRLAGLVALALLLGGSADAQGPARSRPAPSRPAPPRPPSFGSDSKGAEEPAPALSRGELLRRFDLNFDGKLDEAEGELGRAKLRREREEEEQRRREGEAINPLTGRPRSEEGLEKKADPRKRRIISIDDLLPEGMAEGNEGEDPLSRSGRGTASRNDQGEPIDPSAAARARSGSLFGSTEAPRSAARKPTTAPDEARGPGLLSGGVRAGAPPARPGYGAPSTTPPGGGSKTSRPLNAGRPAGSLLPGSSTARPGAPAAGSGSGARPPARPQTGRSSAAPPTEAAPRVPLFPSRPIE